MPAYRDARVVNCVSLTFALTGPGVEPAAVPFARDKARRRVRAAGVAEGVIRPGIILGVTRPDWNEGVIRPLVAANDVDEDGVNRPELDADEDGRRAFCRSLMPAVGAESFMYFTNIPQLGGHWKYDFLNTKKISVTSIHIE